MNAGFPVQQNLSDNINRHLSDIISIDPKIYMWTIERLSQHLPALTCKVLHEFVLVD